MSYTPEDAWLDEAYSQMVEEVLREHRDDIIGEFVSERMASYHKQNPDLLAPAVSCLEEARKLQSTSASASLVFSQATIEIALRDVILEPVVFGMVHEESTGPLIAELVVGNRQFTRLLFAVLEEHGLNLRTRKRKGSSKSLWEEMEDIKKVRHSILHRGAAASERDAQLALTLAELFVERLYPYIEQRMAGR